jgi:hypothetical protein
MDGMRWVGIMQRISYTDIRHCQYHFVHSSSREKQMAMDDKVPAKGQEFVKATSWGLLDSKGACC